MGNVLQQKKILSDVVWSVFSLALMHGTLQLLVYPKLNATMGAERFGGALYVLAVLGIFSQSIGLSANNTRLVLQKERLQENGDYMLAIVMQLAPCGILFVWLIKREGYSGGETVMAILLLLFTTLRFYGDVEYRLTLRYRDYFFYYAAISAGYVLGVAFYPLLGSWLGCFLLGELFCALLIALRGKVYYPLTASGSIRRVLRSMLPLTAAYLLDSTVLYMDRILLQNLVGSEETTVFYFASLFGKTAALLTGPLSGVIIGYLTKNDAHISRKQYLLAGAASLAAGIVLYGAMMIAAPVYARLFYPDIANEVLKYAWAANLSQIICFAAAPLLTIMLTVSSMKWQLIIQCVYAAEFIVFGILGAETGGLWGFIWAGMAANIVRLIIVFAVGCIQLKKQKYVI